MNSAWEKRSFFELAEAKATKVAMKRSKRKEMALILYSRMLIIIIIFVI